jgi:hypothetical protein
MRVWVRRQKTRRESVFLKDCRNDDYDHHEDHEIGEKPNGLIQKVEEGRRLSLFPDPGISEQFHEAHVVSLLIRCE